VVIRDLPAFGRVLLRRFGSCGELRRGRRSAGKLPNVPQHLQPVPNSLPSTSALWCGPHGGGGGRCSIPLIVTRLYEVEAALRSAGWQWPALSLASPSVRFCSQPPTLQPPTTKSHQ
jgi:hypothetical protein